MSGKKTVYWSPRHWIYFKATVSILCLHFSNFSCVLCFLGAFTPPPPPIYLLIFLFPVICFKLSITRTTNSKSWTFLISLEDRLELSGVDCCLIVFTAISRKVFGKSAPDNPYRYCRWFWVCCSSKKFERMARGAMDVCLRVLKESNKRNFDSYCLEQCIDHIPHYLSGSSGAHFCRQPFSK